MSRRTIIVSEEKKEYEVKMNALMDQYARVMFVTIENVRSQQIHNIRRELRGKGVLIMGKKTLQRKIVENRANRADASENDKAFFEKATKMDLLRFNTGLLFTNEDAATICELLEKHRIQAPARVGAIAPVDVIVPAGNTGLEPTMTSFFQALNIATKITKGTVEILNDKQVVTTGEKVDNSTATLLAKLKIFPFFDRMEVKSMWDRGVIFDAADLSVTETVVEQLLVNGIQNISALSLGAGIPTEASLPIAVTEAFKKLIAAAITTKYDFNDFGIGQSIKDIREGKLAAAATPAAPAASGGQGPDRSFWPGNVDDDDDDDDMGGLF
jgi:large subunit ribosomal protein LP0